MPPLSVTQLLQKGRLGSCLMLNSRCAVTTSRVCCPQRQRLQTLELLTPEAFKSVEEAQVARTTVAKSLAMAMA